MFWLIIAVLDKHCSCRGPKISEFFLISNFCRVLNTGQLPRRKHTTFWIFVNSWMTESDTGFWSIVFSASGCRCWKKIVRSLWTSWVQVGLLQFGVSTTIWSTTASAMCHGILTNWLFLRTCHLSTLLLYQLIGQLLHLLVQCCSQISSDIW